MGARWIVVLAVLSAYSLAATIEADSCSNADIQAAVDSANDADTVIIPECSNGLWSGTLSISKAIKLLGMGKGRTVYTNVMDGTALFVNIPAGKLFEFGQLTFRDGDDGASNGMIKLTGEGQFRVHDIEWDNVPGRKIHVGDAWTMGGDTFGPFGVIDNCDFRSDSAMDALQIRITHGADVSWSKPNSFGGPEAVYIEDCNFEFGQYKTGLGSIDCAYGGRYVMRHNNYINSDIKTHGYDSALSSCMQVEIYENSLTINDDSPGPDKFIFIRGGSGYIYYNTAAWTQNLCYNTNLIKLIEYRDGVDKFGTPCFCDGSCSVDGNQQGGWPCHQQVGRGTDDSSYPMHIYGNTITGRCTGQLSVQGSVIKEGRDYVLSPDYDYEPYAYPHPLRQGTVDECDNCHYIRDGANGDGTDWNNALDNLPEALERGHTYYIADGNYGSHTFDDPVSGTQKIILKKATNSDHGTDIGWQDSYGDGQARFGEIDILTSYITLDGQIGGGPNSWTENHGFYLYSDGKGIDSRYSNVPSGFGDVDHIEILHTEIEGHGPDGAGNNDLIYMLGPVHNWHISHSYLHDSGRVHILANNVYNSVIEYSYFARLESVPEEHAESIAWQKGDNNVIRYNYFVDGAGTGAIVLKKNQDSWTNDNFEIYGNVFYNTPGYSKGFGNGVICDTSGGVAASTNMKVYNNVFVNLYGNSGINWVMGSSNQAYNNIWYHNHYVVSFKNTGHDYNWFYDNWREDRTPPIYLDDDLVDSEPNAQFGTGDPFVDWQNENFQLAMATEPGIELQYPYNSDYLGEIRGQDGVWDRGAYEFTGTCTPMTITELSLVIQQWKDGSRTIEQVMQAINQWKTGC